ncbi:bicyclomycin resistance protein [Rickettsia canadensis str. CA410]|uniref:Bicyclomycin resistance protein n=1 Tax=Rickettsia canadensis str. CA410 TaxID=1105107 RepID=A0ABM5MS99_RICCA|nr:bicyclomycin resistance protein [Rickettsia canadensis str. CA410]
MTELLLGINLTAYCITALIVSNLGDRYGRRLIINTRFTDF